MGSLALGLLLVLGLASRYVPEISQDEWGIGWRLAYALALCASLFATFYDRKNFPQKTWNFNPKRGALYFVLGWIIFPLMIGIEAVSGTDFTFGEMVLTTLALSVVMGVFGTFTENVGV